MTAHRRLPQDVLPDVGSVKQIEGVGGEQQLRGVLHDAQVCLKEERTYIRVQFLVYSVKHDEGGSLDLLEQPRCHSEEAQLALCLVILQNVNLHAETPVGEHNLRPVVSVVDGKAAFLKSAENKQLLKEPASLAVLVMDKLVPSELRHRLDIGVAVGETVVEVVVDLLHSGHTTCDLLKATRTEQLS